MLAAAVDDGQVFLLLAREVGIAVHQLAESEDGIERGAQFVAHVGQEDALGLVGGFGLTACLLKLADVIVDHNESGLFPTHDHGQPL